MLQKLGAAEIATLLRKKIAGGVLSPHDRLPAERQLAATYGVARGTVREALLRLEDEGQVEIRPGSGTYVASQQVIPTSEAISSANPMELIDARFALEPHICRLAVLHGRRSDFAKLDALCSVMEDCTNDAEGFSDADTAFHKQLADTAGNGLLDWMIGQINTVRRHDEWTRMRTLTLNAEIIREYNQQHREVLEAIRSREPERAASAMKLHLETARLSLTRAAAA